MPRSLFPALLSGYSSFEQYLTAGTLLQQGIARPQLPCCWIACSVLRMILFHPHSTPESRVEALNQLKAFLASGRWKLDQMELSYCNWILSLDARLESMDERRRSLLSSCQLPAGNDAQIATSIHLLVLWSALVSAPHGCVLQQVVSNPSAVANRFVPGFSQSPPPVSGLGTRYWRHTCGYVYAIGNCGRPMVQQRCPSCHNGDVGGRSHEPAPGNVEVSEAELHLNLCPRGIIFDGSAVVRNFNQTECTLLRQLILAGLLLCDRGGWDANAHSIVPHRNSNTTFKDLIATQFSQNATALAESINSSLATSFEIVEAFLFHAAGWNMSAVGTSAIFNSPTLREEWENQWRVSCSVSATTLRSGYATAVDALNQMRTPDSKESQYIAGIIPIDQVPPAAFDRLLLALLPDTERMSNFGSNMTQEKRAAFPLLSFTLSHDRMVANAHLLPQAAAFVESITSGLNLKFSESQLMEMTIQEAIQYVQGASPIQNILDNYEAFKTLWNLFREDLFNFQCEAIQIPELSETVRHSYTRFNA